MSLTAPRRILLGLIGAGIGRSLTPAMHEREAAANGMNCLYQLLDLDRLGMTVEQLPELLDAAERMGFSGLNVTYPAKQHIIPLLDSLCDDARAIGAVNTVVFKNGKRIGHNTDWWGFAESFKASLPDVTMGEVVQLGAGGAGAATAHAALMMGTRTLRIVDADRERAEILASALSARFGEGRAVACRELDAAMRVADGLIHATPTGMAKHPGLPLPAELLRPGQWVSEIVYFPLQTALLQAAQAKGCRTMTGGGMAVFQAVKAFELFTGVKPSAERMQMHFQELQAGSRMTS
ncbi:shikimate dehydrogenase [Duganella sp. CT11-25]|uniref:shikimate dehydrogenase n=1 Tax=unclassified Duganella TaxID=2636909 RepID=UPI0039B0D4EB